MPAFAYLSVFVIALGNVLFGLDWLSAPMAPMADTEAGLRAAAPAPVTVPSANMGTPIVAPGLIAPARPNVPATAGTAPGGVPPAPATASEPRCNLDACTAAYRSFRASDCTYQPIGGPRRLCTK
jgi:BA14K-like protein